jgi:hypothetical protein
MDEHGPNEAQGPLGWASRRMIIAGRVSIAVIIGAVFLLAGFFSSNAKAPSRSNTLLAALPLKYYGVDRAAPVDYPWLSRQGIGFVVVSFDVNGSESEWRSILSTAQANNISVVVWPSDWTEPPVRANCNWYPPYPVTLDGDISRATRLMDVAAEYSAWIGIVNAHEPAWSCKSTVREMAGLKDKLKAYALTKGRSIKVWNYIDNISDISSVPGYSSPADYDKIMDVAVIWQHCAGGAEGSCVSAQAKIVKDRQLLTEAGSKAELVFLQQTFTTGGYSTKFTLAQLQDYSCQSISTGALDGFAFYTWSANWWADLSEWPDLWPAIPYIRDCAGAAPPTTPPAQLTATRTPTKTMTPARTPTKTPTPLRTPTITPSKTQECQKTSPYSDGTIITVCK